MTLYSDPICPVSHAVRMVLAEKGINVEIHQVDQDERPEDLVDLNPYDEILTLVDRDLVLYEAQIMMEYLDDRFPHPPLMPVDPVSRASNRQMRYRIQTDLYDLIAELDEATTAEKTGIRKMFKDHLTAIAPAFKQMPYFMSEEYTLADCYLAPLLWRLPLFGIELPRQAKPLKDYAEKLFAREAFKDSLTEAEKEMRP